MVTIKKIKILPYFSLPHAVYVFRAISGMLSCLSKLSQIAFVSLSANDLRMMVYQLCEDQGR